MPIDTRRIKNRRKLRFETFKAALDEVESLVALEKEGKLQRLGNWSLAQSLNHLSTWMEYAFTGAPVPAPWFVKLMVRPFRGVILNKGMMAGVNIRGIPNGTLGQDDGPLDPALARFRTATTRLNAECPKTPNVLFGTLNHEDWKKLNLRHCELHLGFYVPR
jgi:Protein of unknown function (DUF1569)